MGRRHGNGTDSRPPEKILKRSSLKDYPKYKSSANNKTGPFLSVHSPTTELLRMMSVKLLLPKITRAICRSSAELYTGKYF